MISLGIELVKSFNDRYITMYKTVIKTTEDFKSKAKEIFGDYYDYTKTDILKKDSKRRVIITCPKHGDFYKICIVILMAVVVLNVERKIWLRRNHLQKNNSLIRQI